MIDKKERDKLYYLNNKKEILKKNKIWRDKNKEKLKIIAHIRYLENKKEILKKNKEWYYKNLDFVRKQQKTYRITERIKYPEMKLIESLRVRTGKVFNSQKTNKNNKTIELLGCTKEEFKEHNINNFKDGMTLDNYGLWEVDHIIPLSFYDLSKLEQQKMAFNYLNTQPLWKKDNLRKGAKLEWQQ